MMKRWWGPASLVLVVAMVTMLPWIGSYPLLPEWEPHYGQVVREMHHEGHWLDPTYRGSPFYDKPILPFLMELVSFSVLGTDEESLAETRGAALREARARGEPPPHEALFGRTELAVRLPMALAGIAGVLALYFLVGRIYGRRTALLAALMLATTPFFYLVARQFMFDAPFVVLNTTALLCLVLGAIPKPDGELEPRRRKYLLAMWILIGLGIITKGALAIAVPGAIGMVYILITLDWRVMKRLEPWWGVPVMLAVAAPWFVYMTNLHGELFLRAFFYEHHIERMAGELDKPEGTFEFYVREIGVGLMPWVALLPLGLAHAFGTWKLRLDRAMWRDAFLRLAFLAPFVFFTLSSTKFPHYVLPAVPFLVLLMARAVDSELEDPERRTSRLLWVLALVVVGLIAKDLLEGRNYRLVFYLFTTHRLQDFHPLVGNPYVAFSIVFGLVGLVTLVALIRQKLGWAGFLAMLMLNLGYAIYLNSQMVPALCNMFSSRSLVARFLELREEGDGFGDFRTWKTRAETFYLPLDTEMARISSLGGYRSLVNDHPGGRVFIAVCERDLGRLREIARQAGDELHVIGDDSWEDYREVLLVSNRQSEDYDPRAEAIIDHHPSPQQPSEAVFDGRIRLLGGDATPAEASPDGTVEVTYYFECLQTMEQDAQIFTHIEAVEGGTRWVSDHHPVGSRFPTSMWREGDLVRDRFTVTVPTTAASGTYRVMMGFFVGDDRWRVTPAGENDGGDRTEAVRFEVR
jgi:4-amino-4-deoxy-L-arabinose transferase-like glycosyltransferase